MMFFLSTMFDQWFNCLITVNPLRKRIEKHKIKLFCFARILVLSCFYFSEACLWTLWIGRKWRLHLWLSDSLWKCCKGERNRFVIFLSELWVDSDLLVLVYVQRETKLRMLVWLIGFIGASYQLQNACFSIYLCLSSSTILVVISYI